MIGRFTLVPLAAALLAAGVTLGAAPTAASAADDLIDATPSQVSLETPAPGESVEWSMSVRNLTSGVLPLTLDVEGSAEQLFEGATPLTLELRDPRSGEILYSGPAAEAMDRQFDLPDLGASGDYRLSGIAALPASAGNEYQESSARMTFEFRTLRDDIADPGRPGLPITGSDLGGWLWGAGIALVGGTAIVIISRRKA